MFVLLPDTPPSASRRPSLVGVVSIALLCVLLAAVAFVAAAAPARGATHDRSRQAMAPPRRETIAAPSAVTFTEMMDSLARQVDELANTPSIRPTVGSVSSKFSLRRDHPVLHVARPHEGVDIAAPFGAPVVAPAAAVVSTVAERAGYGLLLELDHGHGMITRYGHLSRVRVRAGEAVARGQLIANVGSSGLSTGPHLHYEIRVDGAVVDPLLVGP